MIINIPFFSSASPVAVETFVPRNFYSCSTSPPPRAGLIIDLILSTYYYCLPLPGLIRTKCALRVLRTARKICWLLLFIELPPSLLLSPVHSSNWNSVAFDFAKTARIGVLSVVEIDSGAFIQFAPLAPWSPHAPSKPAHHAFLLCPRNPSAET